VPSFEPFAQTPHFWAGAGALCRQASVVSYVTTSTNIGKLKMDAPALTLKDFCDAYRVCRETAYQQIRAGRLRAVKLGRKTLILRADADAWAAALPELRTAGREQASA
jgi:excisionase family DNA binding protein